MNIYNIRQMQAYASLCLWEFCLHFDIKHQSINDFVFHLISILSAQNLPEWEKKGLSLDIIGRGDPLPEDVSGIIPPYIFKDFSELVEVCVEVGIVDMYGASTGNPLIFLERCISILKINNVKLPSSDIIEKFDSGKDSWGEAISQSEIDKFISQVLRKF